MGIKHKDSSPLDPERLQSKFMADVLVSTNESSLTCLEATNDVDIHTEEMAPTL